MDIKLKKKYRNKTKDGYQILAMVSSGFTLHGGSVLEYHMICKKDNQFIVGYSYDITTGEWVDSAKFNTYDEAVERFKQYV